MRAQERAETRSVLAAVAAGHEDTLHRRRCLVTGCEKVVPAVTIGAVHIALCARHKTVFDQAWQQAHGRRRSGAA